MFSFTYIILSYVVYMIYFDAAPFQRFMPIIDFADFAAAASAAPSHYVTPILFRRLRACRCLRCADIAGKICA